MSERPDWLQLAAAKQGVPENWQWFHSEWKGEGSRAFILLKGGVSGGVFVSGKNKGKPNPKKRTDVRELVITRDDLAAVRAEYERQTGKCAECFGEKRTAFRWSKDNGTEYRDCRKCRGTGAVAP